MQLEVLETTALGAFAAHKSCLMNVDAQVLSCGLAWPPLLPFEVG
jgi:hypothetical protein